MVSMFNPSLVFFPIYILICFHSILIIKICIISMWYQHQSWYRQNQNSLGSRQLFLEQISMKNSLSYADKSSTKLAPLIQAHQVPAVITCSDDETRQRVVSVNAFFHSGVLFAFKTQQSERKTKFLTTQKDSFVFFFQKNAKSGFCWFLIFKRETFFEIGND